MASTLNQFISNNKHQEERETENAFMAFLHKFKNTNKENSKKNQQNSNRLETIKNSVVDLSSNMNFRLSNLTAQMVKSNQLVLETNDGKLTGQEKEARKEDIFIEEQKIDILTKIYETISGKNFLNVKLDKQEDKKGFLSSLFGLITGSIFFGKIKKFLGIAGKPFSMVIGFIRKPFLVLIKLFKTKLAFIFAPLAKMGAMMGKIVSPLGAIFGGLAGSGGFLSKFFGFFTKGPMAVVSKLIPPLGLLSNVLLIGQLVHDFFKKGPKKFFEDIKVDILRYTRLIVDAVKDFFHDLFTKGPLQIIEDGYQAVKSFFTTNEIGIIIADFLKNTIYGLGDLADSIIEVVFEAFGGEQLYQDIKNKVKSFFNWVEDLFSGNFSWQDLWDGITNTFSLFLNKAGDLFGQIATYIGDNFLSWVKSLGNFVLIVANTLGSVFKTMFKAGIDIGSIIAEKIADVWKNLFAGLGNLFDKIVVGIVNWWDGGSESGAKGLFNNIVSGIVGWFSAGGNLIDKIVTTIKDAFNDIITFIKDTMKEFLNGLGGEVVAGAVSAVKEGAAMVKNAATNVAEKVGEAYDAAAEIAGDIKDKVVDAASSAGEAISDGAKAVWQQMASDWNGLFGDKSKQTKNINDLNKTLSGLNETVHEGFDKTNDILDDNTKRMRLFDKTLDISKVLLTKFSEVVNKLSDNILNLTKNIELLFKGIEKGSIKQFNSELDLMLGRLDTFLNGGTYKNSNGNIHEFNGGMSNKENNIKAADTLSELKKHMNFSNYVTPTNNVGSKLLAEGSTTNNVVIINNYNGGNNINSNNVAATGNGSSGSEKQDVAVVVNDSSSDWRNSTASAIHAGYNALLSTAI